MVMSASCSHNSKETRRMQTVKIDTVFSVEGQTPLQFPGKVKAAQNLCGRRSPGKERSVVGTT